MKKLIFFCLFSSLSLFLSNCQKESSQKSDENEPALLVQQYCGNCHQQPDPEILPLHIWEEIVLPRMGYHLGIYPSSEFRETLFENNAGGEIVQAAGLYPEEPVLSDEQWLKIQEFFLDRAPKKLDLPDPVHTIDLKLFERKIPDYFLSPPSTTMVKIREEGGLYIGEANKRALFQFNDQLEMINQANLREGPVDILETPNDILVQIMGSFSPTDEPSGLMVRLPKKQGQAQIIADKLQRPVDFSVGDLNGDNRPELVCAEFGKWTGALSLFEATTKGLQRRVIDASPGVVKSMIYDINEDGFQDIVALFAQGNERITAYLGDGNGEFKRRNLLALHPSMGSCFLDTIDWDLDGDLDLIYCAGDNADYSPILKPYHGIYIFENKGDLVFEESFFYHQYGAYKAIPRDFDQDGDMDLAAISFFPDFEKGASEMFLYLENDGRNQFTPHSFDGLSLGRWIVMDVGDFDLDGDEDLALGSLTMEVPGRSDLIQEWIKKGIPFIILENKLKG